MKKDMILIVYPDYGVAGAEGTFQISSIEDNEGNDLEDVTKILTNKGHRDYHLEDEEYVGQIKTQLRDDFNDDLVDSLQIELGSWS